MRSLCIAFACLAAIGSVGAGEDRRPEIAARVELHPLLSRTLSDAEFLRGEREAGRPVTVAGEFRIAQGQRRLPVVVMIHGSSGVGPNIEPWTQLLNAMGVSTFVIDGFTGRGLTGTGADQALLGRLNLVLDGYRTLDVLAKHPRVDPSRIVLMGFSRGGQAALFAAMDRLDRMWNGSGIRYAAHIPFYPDCSTSYLSDTEISAPIRVFHGTPDDYNPVASCRAYLGRLKDAGRDVALTEYPNAQHGFDSPLMQEGPSVATRSQTVRRCTIRETQPGVLTNADTSAPFSYQDACVERDPHVGGDLAATQAARDAVAQYLKATLRLP